jgi:hypothetical protein
MAVITSQAIGNFADGSTWVGGVAPTSTDTFVIAAGHEVTIAADVTSAGGTVESLQGGGLINNAKLTMTGHLNLGNGSGRDGCFTFGPGSELELVSADVVMNNCRLRNTSTAEAWAKVTGAGGFVRGVVYTYPKMDIVLQYVAFTAVGRWDMSCNYLYGAASIVNQCECSHITIVNATDIVIGRGSGGTPASANLRLTDSDIRNYTGSLLLSGTDKTTGAREFLRNTCSQSSDLGLSGVAVYSTGWDTTGSVFDRVHTKSSAYGTSTKPLKQQAIFMGSGLSTDNFINSFGWQGFTGATLDDSYFYVPPGTTNPHCGGGLQDGSLARNVFEVYGSEPNLVVSGTTAMNGTMNIVDNLAIGTGSFFNQVGNNTGTGTMNVLHNTVFSTGGTGVHKGLFLAENGNFAGTLNLKSNISAVKSDTTLDYSVWDNDFTPQPINSDYNCFHNLAVSPYYGVDITGAVNDTTVNPQFVDETRCLAKWGAEIGVDETYAAVVGELLRRNGYDPATMTQSATPSSVTPADLVAWVRAGFAPTNAALQDAGHDGVTIGAMEYVSASATHDLTASDLVTGSPVLGTPALGQVHALTATGITTSAPILGTPALGQVHELTATALVVGSPVLDTPLLTENAPDVDALTAVDLVVGSPVLGTPAIGQIHVLGSDGLVTGAPVLGSPLITQIHTLEALGLTVGVPVLGTPALNGSDIVLITAAEVARIVRATARMRTVKYEVARA